MTSHLRLLCLAALLFDSPATLAGQAPGPASAPDIAISHRDRVYAAEQFSNTISVTDPADNRLLGVIRLGDPQPANFLPLYRGQVLVHGLGFSPDHRTLAVVAVGSNSVTFIDTATNAIRKTVYVGRAPHEAFFTPDGKEVWVTVRGENYVQALDGRSFEPIRRMVVPNGPGMQSFSPDGKYGFVCSSFTPETDVISLADHVIVARLVQASPFCPNIAVTPDGSQVWLTLKDSGKTEVFAARPPFRLLKILNTGPITNHVNFIHDERGTFAYVTVGGLNMVKAFDTKDYGEVARVPVGDLPHGVWPSGDGTRIYVGLENGDALAAIDTRTNKVIATIPVGQAPQAVVYVPDAVPTGDGRQGLEPLGVAGQAAHFPMGPSDGGDLTSVTMFDQGLVQVIQAAAAGLKPQTSYVLALAERKDGGGQRQPLAVFRSNAAGAAVVDASGPIRQIVAPEAPATRRYLVIFEGTPADMGALVQAQRP